MALGRADTSGVGLAGGRADIAARVLAGRGAAAVRACPLAGLTPAAWAWLAWLAAGREQSLTPAARDGLSGLGWRQG